MPEFFSIQSTFFAQSVKTKFKEKNFNDIDYYETHFKNKVTEIKKLFYLNAYKTDQPLSVVIKKDDYFIFSPSSDKDHLTSHWYANRRYLIKRSTMPNSILGSGIGLLVFSMYYVGFLFFFLRYCKISYDSSKVLEVFQKFNKINIVLLLLLLFGLLLHNLGILIFWEGGYLFLLVPTIFLVMLSLFDQFSVRKLKPLFAKNYQVVIMLALVYITFAIIYIPLFINASGLMGHDHMNLMFQLFPIHTWVQNNGLFEMPWFLPHKCGGVVQFGSHTSASGYFTLNYLLFLFFNPFKVIIISFLVYALIGMVSFYFLLTSVFCYNKKLSILGSVLFLFTAYFINRMLVGHVNHATFMLCPVILILLLYDFKGEKSKKLFFNIFCISLMSLILAYTVYELHPTMIATLGIVMLIISCIFYSFHSEKKYIWHRLSVTFILTALIISAKGYSSFVLSQHFPRNVLRYHTIEGFSIFLISYMKAMFFQFKPEIFPDNGSLHEADFSVTPIPLAIILAYLILSFKQVKFNYNKRISWGLLLTGLFILSISALYTYDNAILHNEIVRKFPFFKNNLNPIRWFAICIPFIIILSIFLLSRLYKKNYNFIYVFLIGLILLFNIMKDLSNYTTDHWVMSFDIKPFNKIYENNFKNAFSQEAKLPPVTKLLYIPNQTKVQLYNATSFLSGVSRINCNEPLFASGYPFEKYPTSKLKPGSVYQTDGQYFNMMNPVCNLYPEENNCQIGERFKISQKEDLENFLNYRKYNYTLSKEQVFFNWLSLVTFSFTLLYVIFFVLFYMLRHLGVSILRKI